MLSSKDSLSAEVINTLSLFLQKSCREGCGLSQSVTVPQTTVDFDVWEKKNVSNH